MSPDGRFFVESYTTDGTLVERIDYPFSSKPAAELFRKMSEKQEPELEWRVTEEAQVIA